MTRLIAICGASNAQARSRLHTWPTWLVDRRVHRDGAASIVAHVSPPLTDERTWRWGAVRFMVAVACATKSVARAGPR